MTDDEAVARLIRGDIGGLDQLVATYQRQALGAAYLIVQNRTIAEDIVQAAFLRIYERISQFDTRRPFGPWFLRIVVNDALTAVVRRERFEAPASTAAEVQLVDPGPELDTLLVAAETRTAVWTAVRTLPPEQRAAVVLRYYLDLSEAEVAAHLGLPKSTIKWRLHVARQRLRTILPAWLHPGAPAAPGIHVSPTSATPNNEEGGRL